MTQSRAELRLMIAWCLTTDICIAVHVDLASESGMSLWCESVGRWGKSVWWLLLTWTVMVISLICWSFDLSLNSAKTSLFVSVLLVLVPVCQYSMVKSHNSSYRLPALPVSFIFACSLRYGVGWTSRFFKSIGLVLRLIFQRGNDQERTKFTREEVVCCRCRHGAGSVCTRVYHLASASIQRLYCLRIIVVRFLVLTYYAPLESGKDSLCLTLVQRAMLSILICCLLPLRLLF